MIRCKQRREIPNVEMGERAWLGGRKIAKWTFSEFMVLYF